MNKAQLKWMAAGAAITIGLGIVIGLIVMYSGVYNVAAISQHSKPVYWIFEKGMRASVERHSAGIEAPDLDDPQLLRAGAQCYQLHCAQCHGAPGIAPDGFGNGMLPLPNNLTQTAHDWPAEQIYWVTRNGIRMAGMPAWAYRLSDRDLWAITAFVDRQLPKLTAADYAQLMSEVADERCTAPEQTARIDAERGRIAIAQYGCHGCHIVPGLAGPETYVGPSLAGFASRTTIAGVVPHTRGNLIRWLRDPRGVSPDTLMPDLGVTAQHAAEMAAYLATLR
ncbi:MAG TPA: c-type cytochrome [Steroidobacteraceae bacterium]